MPWIIPELTALVTHRKLSRQEFDAIKSKGLVDGDTADEALQRAHDDVVAYVRAKVGAKYVLGPDGTIPPSLVGVFLDILRIEFLSSLPGLKSLITEERRAAAEAARTRLNDVAKGMEAVELAEQPAASQPAIGGSGATLISSGRGSATHAQTNGLF